MITYIREWVLSIIELESSENLISLSDYTLPAVGRCAIEGARNGFLELSKILLD